MSCDANTLMTQAAANGYYNLDERSLKIATLQLLCSGGGGSGGITLAQALTYVQANATAFANGLAIGANISLNADGSVQFAGVNIAVAGSATFATGNMSIQADGTVTVAGKVALNPDGSAFLLLGLTAGGGTIHLNSGGSADFASGAIQLAADGSATFLNNQVGIGVIGGAIQLMSDGSAAFANGTVAVSLDGNLLGQAGSWAINLDGSANFGFLAFSISAVGAVTTSQDMEITNTAKGVILKSPNGTRYRLKVDNAGNLGTEAA